MSKKNKLRKHSMAKRQQRGVIAILSQMKAVAVRLQSQVSDDNSKANTRVYNASTCKPYTTDITVQKHLTSTRMKWAIWVGFFARDQFGKEYIQGEWIVAKELYYFDELSEVLREEIDRLYEQSNKAHLLDGGWLAVPYNKELNDQTLTKIFTDYGAFEGIAEWETKGKAA